MMIIRPETLVRWHRAGLHNLSIKEKSKICDGRHSEDTPVVRHMRWRTVVKDRTKARTAHIAKHKKHRA
jgi:hypothetical protein